MLNEDEMNQMDETELNRRINLWKKIKIRKPNFHV